MNSQTAKGKTEEGEEELYRKEKISQLSAPQWKKHQALSSLARSELTITLPF